MRTDGLAENGAKPAEQRHDWRWRRETAKEFVKAMLGNWQHMPPGTDAAVLAVKLTDDLLLELRKGAFDAND